MKDDKFKKIISIIDLEEPGHSFTDNIMKMIGSREELSLPPALQAAIEGELLAEPSFDFPDNLMANIEPRASSVLEPIISRKTWLIIFGVVASALFLVLINFHSGASHLPNSSYFSGFILDLSITAKGVTNIIPAVFPYLISLSILLYLDYFFRARQRQFTSGQQDR